MVVHVEWVLEPRIARGVLGDGPAVVCSRDPLVDLFPGVHTDIVDVVEASAGLDSGREWVPQPDRPDCPIDARRLAVKRVVRWDRAVGVDPEDLAQRSVQRLRVRRMFVLADADVELAIGTELERTAVMMPAVQRGKIEQWQFAGRIRRVARDREATDAIVGRASRNRVVDVNVMVDQEVGIDCDPNQYLRSAVGSVVTWRRGAGSSFPFWMTRTAPVCWITSSLPSGTATIPLGSFNPRTTTDATNPRGRTVMRTRSSMPATNGRKPIRRIGRDETRFLKRATAWEMCDMTGHFPHELPQLITT